MPWFKVIRRPEEEQKLLKQRESNKNFNEIDLPNDDGSRDNQWTRLSAFTFINSTVPQRTFNNNNNMFGIVVNERIVNPRQVYWRDSNDEVVSDEIFKQKKTNEEFIKSCENESFIVKAESDISALLESRYAELKKVNKTDFMRIRWSEGLFRYKLADVSGVVINPHDVASCKAGKNFMDFLRRERCSARYYTITQDDIGNFEAEKMQEIEEKQLDKMASKRLPPAKKSKPIVFPGDNFSDSTDMGFDLFTRPKTSQTRYVKKLYNQRTSDTSAYFKCRKYTSLDTRKPITEKITSSRFETTNSNRSR